MRADDVLARRTRRCRRAAATLTAVAAAALAGCSAAPGPVALPPHAPAAAVSPSPYASPSPSAVPSVREQVIAADLGYTRAVVEAQASGNSAKARRLLNPYLAPNAVGVLVSAMANRWSDGEFAFGGDVPHIRKVTVHPKFAFVYECDDTSSGGWEYKATRKIVPGSQDDPILNLITRLDLTHGRWLVQFQTILAATCKP